MARYRNRDRSDARLEAGLSGSVGAATRASLRRCAIYTRKSTEEGLDQGFNSLDAQREACEAYVVSQRHEGWQVLPQGYDDGGYSGGSMVRPRLQALLSAIDRATFEAVQQRLAANANSKRLRALSQAILTGRIFDSRGNRMAPTHSNKGGVRYHYYVTRAIAEGRPKEAGTVRRVPAREIEQIVIETIAQHCGPVGSPGSDAHNGPASDLRMVQRHLRRIEVQGDHLRISLAGASPGGNGSDPVACPATGRSAEGGTSSESITVNVAWTPPSQRPRREVRLAAEPKPHPLRGPLIAQIVTGRRWLQELIDGAVTGIEAIARREGKHPRSIRSTLSFALLAPDIVARIIDGAPLPDHLTLTTIGRGLPILWSEQRRLFGMAQAAAGR